MGKQKIERLLAQLKENQQQDIQNSAAIFTVAQSAVSELAQIEAYSGETASETASETAAPVHKPLQLTKSELVERYGNYNACRRAAKKQGISFTRSPKWSQLVAAFNYVEACQACVNHYIEQHPNAELKGVKLTLAL